MLLRSTFAPLIYCTMFLLAHGELPLANGGPTDVLFETDHQAAVR